MCLPAVSEQMAGVKEVESMVMILQHILAEPYSQSTFSCDSPAAVYTMSMHLLDAVNGYSVQ